jgi:hypothetical protein
MPNNPQWINEKKAEERFNNKEIAFSFIIITVRIKAQAEGYIAKGINFGGKTYKVERFWETGPEIYASNAVNMGILNIMNA